MAFPTQQSPMGDFSRKIFFTMVGILLVYGIVFLGTMIRNNMQTFKVIGRQDIPQQTINITGEGKITVKPDIARTIIGFVTIAPTAKEALEKSNVVVDALIKGLKDRAIADDDIKTETFYVSPHYNWTQETGNVLDGYEVSQQVTVKIRDLSKANDILGFATESGANTVSGITFDIDEPENYYAQARKEAIDVSFKKARTLADQLGVSLVKVVSYSEYGNPSYPMYAGGMMSDSVSMMEKSVTPSIQPGSQDVVVNANITFEIR
jgi:uncharacterized protein YggE